MGYQENIELLDEFLELVKEGAAPKDKEQLRGTQKKELELWHAWNNGGRKPALLKPLFESYKPLIHREMNKFRGLELPTSTLQAEGRKQFVNAVKTYDPKRGTQLSSWVTGTMRKASRFVKTYQNLGKIPEGQIAKITKFKQAKEYLTEQNGHEPDAHALADHLKWSVKRVAQLQTELSRADKPVSGYMHDPGESMTPKELEAIHILQYDSRLTPEDRTVYEYTFGINGKSRLQPGEIAKKTKIHPSKISRIRGKLKNYIQEAIEVL
jgi:RNA polymerase sigma factor (sigma-70 family)